MCTATTDFAPSAQPALAPFITGANYVLAPWRAQWLNDKLVAISNKALKRGIAVMPALLATSEPYSIWHAARGADWQSRRGPDGECLFVGYDEETKTWQKCEGGVCPART